MASPGLCFLYHQQDGGKWASLPFSLFFFYYTADKHEKRVQSPSCHAVEIKGLESGRAPFPGLLVS